MATLVAIDGFEYGINPFLSSTSNGGGIATAVATGANISCDSSIKNGVSSYSLKILESATLAVRITKTLTGANITVISFYFYSTAAPSSACIFFTTLTNVLQLRIDTAGTMSCLFNGGAAQTTGASMCDSTWHRVDLHVDASANPNVCQWQVDGSAQTNATRAQAIAQQTGVQIGSAAGTAAWTFYMDDLVISQTTGDYPIGDHSVLSLFPASDGTHNIGGVIEDNTGTDITTNASSILANWPPSTATYIRQSATGTGNYATVHFSNAPAGTFTTVWDVQPLLAYMSALGTPANEGATIMSEDAWSTTLEVYGTPSARTDYSETALFYKVANTTTAQGVLTRPSGGWTASNINNLRGRVGFSGNVGTIPRWNGLMAQVAGVLGAGGGGGSDERVGWIPV